MDVWIKFVADHWLSLVLLAGIAGATWYVIKHRDKLFYTKPKP